VTIIYVEHQRTSSELSASICSSSSFIIVTVRFHETEKFWLHGTNRWRCSRCAQCRPKYQRYLSRMTVPTRAEHIRCAKYCRDPIVLLISNISYSNVGIEGAVDRRAMIGTAMRSLSCLVVELAKELQGGSQ
jgi:hypothetical protein